jgi:hypothetical protein
VAINNAIIFFVVCAEVPYQSELSPSFATFVDFYVPADPASTVFVRVILVVAVAPFSALEKAMKD